LASERRIKNVVFVCVDSFTRFDSTAGQAKMTPKLRVIKLNQ
jgi:hypothetical protein